MAYLKPQSPLQHKDGDYFYPLTTVDQVVMEDGISRLNSVFKNTERKDIVLLASQWSSNAPYTQTITLDDYIDDVSVDAEVKYTGDLEIDKGLSNAASCLTYVKKDGNNIVFSCLKGKPEIDIPMEITISSVGSIANIVDGIKPNFEIVGGSTKPENPTENMIWVNTNDEINDWMFSMKEPDTVHDGMIWIVMGIAGNVEINVIQNNGIKVYPLYAKHCVSGEWVDVYATSYHNGAWEEWNVYLYKEGNEYVDLTGTWLAKSGTFGSGSARTPTIVRNEDSIRFYQAGSGGGYVAPAKTIDLTNYKTLKAEVTATKDIIYPNWTLFAVYKSIGKLENTTAQAQMTTGRKTYSINISSLSGMHTVGFMLYRMDSTNADITVHKVWLER